MSAASAAVKRIDTPPVAASPWTVSGLVHLSLALLALVVLGLLLSVLVEWIGMALGWWAAPGAEHSAQLLQTELTRLNQDFRASIVGSGPYSMARAGAGLVYRWSGLALLIDWLTTAPIDPEWVVLAVLRTTLHDSAAYLVAAANMSQLYGARLVVALFSLPAFLLFGAVGAIDGLVQRDLRRFGGGIESGFVYHHLKRFLRPLVWLPIVVYLACPISLHPTAVFVPPAVVFGWLIAKTTARFKKYL